MLHQNVKHNFIHPNDITLFSGELSSYDPTNISTNKYLGQQISLPINIIRDSRIKKWKKCR